MRFLLNSHVYYNRLRRSGGIPKSSIQLAPLPQSGFERVNQTTKKIVTRASLSHVLINTERKSGYLTLTSRYINNIKLTESTRALIKKVRARFQL